MPAIAAWLSRGFEGPANRVDRACEAGDAADADGNPAGVAVGCSVGGDALPLEVTGAAAAAAVQAAAAAAG